jgi:hypothetical protein
MQHIKFSWTSINQVMIYISLKKTIGKLKIEKKNNKMKNKKKK